MSRNNLATRIEELCWTELEACSTVTIMIRRGIMGQDSICQRFGRHIVTLGNIGGVVWRYFLYIICRRLEVSDGVRARECPTTQSSPSWTRRTPGYAITPIVVPTSPTRLGFPALLNLLSGCEAAREIYERFYSVLRVLRVTVGDKGETT